MNFLNKLAVASTLLVIPVGTAFAGVTVSNPANGAAVSSPFSLSANAATCSSQPVTAMGYSLDSSTTTTIVYSTVTMATVTATTGAHTLHVKAWGNQGASCDTDIVLTVTSSNISAGANGVSVSMPSNGAAVTSPFALSATASTCSSQPVGTMGYSLDNSSSTTIVYSTSLNTQVTSAAGAHTLHVKAWGNQGASCSASVAITVTGASAPSVPIIPANAISVSSLQTLSGWAAVNDTGGTGSSNGSMSIVTSPALSGHAREFSTKYSNAGDERYYVTFGDDTSAANFLYDNWVYLASPSSGVANLEMDINQVMANGQTVIYGFQCDGYAGTWDYTANRGTPQNPSDQWVKSSEACNVRNWSTNTWHHVQISYYRDSFGNVTYESVWLDGIEQKINATVPSAYALGWATTLSTNFEVDGLGSSGSSIVYMDNLTIYRW